MIESLFGSLFGGLFRLAPEILKWLDRKDERAHELAMFQHQCEVEKIRGTFKLEEAYVTHSTEALNAIQEAFKEQSQTASASYKWVAAASALVRPGVTYVLFGLYVAVKCTSIAYSLHQGAMWHDVLRINWTVEDWAMLNMVLTFWFIGRAIEKYQK